MGSLQIFKISWNFTTFLTKERKNEENNKGYLFFLKNMKLNYSVCIYIKCICIYIITRKGKYKEEGGLIL